MLSVVAAMIALAFVNGAVKPPTLRWDYGEERGPKAWAKIFSPQCAGQKQSPIDIKTKEVMTMETTTPFTITNGWTLKDATLVNTGPLLVINVKEPKNGPILQGGGLPDKYKLAKITFNWGNTNTQGSEHLIDGKAAPLEMKMIFVKVKHTSKEEALKDPEGIAILGVLYDVMTFNTGLEPILKNAAKAKFQGESVVIPEIDLSKLVPDLSNFYRYKGSLTVPSCNENVIWSIATKKMYLATEQLETFRNLYSSPRGSPTMVKMVNNIRETQPLNGRSVYKFTKAKKHASP